MIKIYTTNWWGPCTAAKKLLDDIGLSYENIDIEVIDLLSLQPWDKEIISKSIKKTNRVIILHEANLIDKLQLNYDQYHYQQMIHISLYIY